MIYLKRIILCNGADTVTGVKSHQIQWKFSIVMRSLEMTVFWTNADKNRCPPQSKGKIWLHLYTCP